MRLFASIIIVSLLSIVSIHSKSLDSQWKHDQTAKIFYNGTIYTSTTPRVVTAFAVHENGTILGVGDTKDILEQFRHIQTRINLSQQPVVPGFIDAHAHIIGYGQKLQNVLLNGATSIGEVIARIKPFYDKAKQEKKWVFGSGWDQSMFPSGEFPTRWDLDQSFPDVPIWLDRVDGHAKWANSKVLDIVGNLPKEDPPGGKIIRDEQGRPTGIFVDNAIDLISPHVPKPTFDDLVMALELAVNQTKSFGLTSAHYAAISDEQQRVVKYAIDRGELDLRIYGMIDDSEGVDIDKWCRSGPLLNYRNVSKLTIRSVKFVMDGALGSRGAALLLPYADKPDELGLMLIDLNVFRERIRKYIKCGFQVNTHAIGDRANRVVLENYDRVVRELGKTQEDLRLRIEHAQVIHKEDFAKFARYKIIASIQPTHATTDMNYAQRRLGYQRIEDGAYAWKKLLQSGVKLAMGSDFPVESPNPIYGFYAAVARKNLEGSPQGGWFPSQKLTRDETLHAFTLGAAYAAFEEKNLGSIEAKKLADFVVLSADIMTIPEDDIPKIVAKETYLSGKLVYQRE